MFIKITLKSDKSVAIIPMDTIDYIEPDKEGSTIYYKGVDEHTQVEEDINYFLNILVVSK